MANIIRRKTFASNEVLTPAKLHAFIEDALMSGLTNDEILGALRMINFSEPSPGVQGDNHLPSTAGSHLKFKDASSFQEQATDPVTLFLFNNCGFQVSAGDVVICDPDNDEAFTVADTANLNSKVIGVATETILNATEGDIAIRGRVQVKTLPLASYSAGAILQGPVGSGTNDQKTAARLTADPTAGPGTFGAANFGWILESASGSSTTLVEAYIWK